MADPISQSAPKHGQTRVKPPSTPVDFNALPAELRALRFVLWDYRSTNGGKPAKIPTRPNGQNASSTDPSTWTSFDEARAAYERGSRSGVGVPLGEEGNGYFFVDLDNCCDANGQLDEEARRIVSSLNTYSERSPSGKGVRCILRGGPKIRSVNRGAGVDLFSIGQYVTLTGHHIPESPTEIADADKELDDLIKQYGPQSKARRRATDRELAVMCLDYIDGFDEYETWVAVGMALHQVSDDLLEEWKVWSSQCPEKYNAGECASKWFSFTQRDSGRDLGYLIRLAEPNGFTGEAKPSLANYSTRSNDKGKPVAAAKSQGQLLREFRRIFGEWPKVCRRMLFVAGEESLRELRNEAELFAWMQSLADVRWNSSVGITKGEFFAAVKAEAAEVKYISRVPHYPESIPGTHYLLPRVAGTSCEELAKLIDLMSPETPLDAQLILAAFATVRWSGPAGKRPMFFIQSRDGKGSGKSTLAETIGRVGNRGEVGCFTIAAKRDFETVTKHLVTRLVTERPVLFLDNHVGSLGGQDIESMVTAAEIQGHAMYSGHAAMPNNFTWVITSNDVQAHEDTADRAVVVKIRRPEYDPAWERKLRSIDFAKVEEGINAFFNRPKRKLGEYFRWALWQDEILSRLEQPDEVQLLIRQRATELSAIDADANEVRHRILNGLFSPAGIDSDNAHVFISSRELATVLHGLDGRRDFTATSATRYVKPLIASSELVELELSRDTSRRGFIWRGLNAESQLRDIRDLRANQFCRTGEVAMF